MTTPIVFIYGLATVTCGGGFAFEEVGTFDIAVDWSDVFAGKPAPTGVQLWTVTVGASLLAKDVRALRLSRQHSLSFTSFASTLAPTEESLKLTLT
jgi:hypothetical protein